MYKITSYQFVNQRCENTILYLHGWGCNFHYMLNLTPQKMGFNHLFIDLPGFGKNLDLPHPFTLQDYVVCIQELLDELQIHISYIVGHSFGGKLSIELAHVLQNVKGLFLIAPSIYHKRRGPFFYLKILTYKFIKRIPFFKKYAQKMGSQDYKSLSPVMKKTMSNVIEKQVEDTLKSLHVPILLIFSKKDKVIPMYLAKKIQKKAIDAQIIPIEGDHFGFLYQKNYLSTILNAFVEKTYDC